MAERLLAEGYSVHICDVSKENVDEFVAANSRATATVADIGDRADADRIFSDLLEHHGHLDILINNAGIAGPAVPVEDCDEDGWNECIQTNLSGTLFATCICGKRRCVRSPLPTKLLIQSCFSRPIKHREFPDTHWRLMAIPKVS